MEITLAGGNQDRYAVWALHHVLMGLGAVPIGSKPPIKKGDNREILRAYASEGYAPFTFRRRSYPFPDIRLDFRVPWGMVEVRAWPEEEDECPYLSITSFTNAERYRWTSERDRREDLD